MLLSDVLFLLLQRRGALQRFLKSAGSDSPLASAAAAAAATFSFAYGPEGAFTFISADEQSPA